MNNYPQNRKTFSGHIMGGDRECQCGCGAVFPRTRSSNGKERVYATPSCHSREISKKKKDGTYTKLITVKTEVCLFPGGNAGNATIQQRQNYCHQKTGECARYPETIGQGCYAGQCFQTPRPRNVASYGQVLGIVHAINL